MTILNLRIKEMAQFIVDKYSIFINFPSLMNNEQVNAIYAWQC